MTKIAFNGMFTQLTTNDITRLPQQHPNKPIAAIKPQLQPQADVYQNNTPPKKSNKALKTVITIGVIAAGLVALKRFDKLKPIEITDSSKFMDKAQNALYKTAEYIELPFKKFVGLFKKPAAVSNEVTEGANKAA